MAVWQVRVMNLNEIEQLLDLCEQYVNIIGGNTTDKDEVNDIVKKASEKRQEISDLVRNSHLANDIEKYGSILIPIRDGVSLRVAKDWNGKNYTVSRILGRIVGMSEIASILYGELEQ